jgi:8-amino-7-oxononanoate synthase
LFYEKELDTLRLSNRFRKRVIFGDNLIDLASNDYLGFAEDKELLELAYIEVQKQKYHSAKASMLVNGYSIIHKNFEKKISNYSGFENGIVVGSGFLANIALFESLIRKSDNLFIDKEYHASGFLATRLINNNTKIFAHNSYVELEKLLKLSTAKRKIIAIEGIYSMSGDLANRKIFELADKYNAILIVDEAHSCGIIGDNLMGIFDFYNIKPKSNHIKMGTLSKAYGSYGAYILASNHIITYLENRAKPIIYSTAPSLFDISFANMALNKIINQKQLIKDKIRNHITLMNNMNSSSQKSLIYPIIYKSNISVIKMQKLILKNNILVGAIRQPTVLKPILRIILRVSVKKEFIIKLSKIISKANK